MIIEDRQIYINDNHINDIVLVEIGQYDNMLLEHDLKRGTHYPNRPSGLERRIKTTEKEETPTAKAINDLIDAGYIAYGSIRWQDQRMYQPMVLFNK